MGPAPQATQGARHFTLLRSFHLADFFTLANGSCGTAAIFFAMAHMREAMALRVYAAGALIGLALVFDVVDGRVARWRHHASPLGRELDSLADVISFGVAPACLAYAAGMNAILDQLAKYERAKISERSRRGTLQKAREGKVLAVHRPPYGFRYNDARDNSLVDAGRMAVI